MLAAVNVMLRGLPFIYQGQELGMTNVVFHSIDEIDDCSTLDEYQVALDAGLTPESAFKAVVPYSRDNARTHSSGMQLLTQDLPQEPHG